MDIFPPKEKYIEDSKQYSVIPIFTEFTADFETPVSIFEKVKGDSILESVESGGNVGRYSFITIGKKACIELWGKNFTIKKFGTEHKVIYQDSGSMDNPLLKVREFLQEFKAPQYEGLPPVFGGAIGYLGYETISYFENIKTNESNEVNIPDGIFITPEVILVYDLIKKSVTVVVTTFSGNNPEQCYDYAVEKIGEVTKKIGIPTSLSAYKILEDDEVETIKSDFSKEEFEVAVKKCQEYIVNGDIIQIVISRQSVIETDALPFDLYRTLRIMNPSPYLFFLNFEDFYLIGSSPEVMVRVHDGEMLLKPIAGTRKRGKSITQDCELANELINDEKERAEHLMLVDLGRNDLGKVAVGGSVKVTDYMAIEKYSHVMHIVSTIKAKLKENCDAFDVIMATFPAGTLTGAPKIRAMEIIEKIEKQKRGAYGGMVFNIGFNGNLDSCITIRSMVLKDNKAYIRSGAGIVADSVGESEYYETVNKAMALVKTVKKTGGRIF